VIPEAPGETWAIVNGALESGRRGLPGRSSLARLLNERCGVRNLRLRRGPLTLAQILIWADAHHRRTGRWPIATSGSVTDAPDESWALVNGSLHRGRRGLPKGSSLARLLEARRGVRNRMTSVKLTEAQILKWADRHFARTGQWPSPSSGSLHEAPGETWRNISQALYRGSHGLPGGTSLPDLLSRKRGVRNVKHPPPLTVAQVVTWARRHHGRTGEWPKSTSGSIVGASGETWSGVDNALFTGLRGLPKGSSLPRVLQAHCGVRNTKGLEPLTIAQIVAWAHQHHRRTGEWPHRLSGTIPGTGGEPWSTVDAALAAGRRGLAGGSSLSRLIGSIAKHTGRPSALR
jgi:hypothetical protein